eukprot:11181256-Lingulodinium_polyedra.AAC.1
MPWSQTWPFDTMPQRAGMSSAVPTLGRVAACPQASIATAGTAHAEAAASARATLRASAAGPSGKRRAS